MITRAPACCEIPIILPSTWAGTPLSSCPSCRALLQGLSLTSDALLQLAPAADPPIGFESRLFAKISGATPPPERPYRARRWRTP